MDRRLALGLLLASLSLMTCSRETASTRPPKASGVRTEETPPPSPEPEAPLAGGTDDGDLVPSAPEEESPLVARHRADLRTIEPGMDGARVDAQVARFAASIEQTKRQPFPSTHTECAAIMKTGAERSCTMVVGDVVKPKWFDACKSSGGTTIKLSHPEGTPLHYDDEICTKIFPAAPN